MALSDWQLILYAANADSSASIAYNDLSLTSISLNSGYTSSAIYIIKPEAHNGFDFNSVSDINGATFGKATRRLAFSIESYPFRFEAGGLQDLDDIDALASVIDGKPYLWARILAGSRKWPNTTNTAHPVNITNWSESVNSSAGTRRLNLTLQHRYKI
jgi:hypothetical protein